MTPLDRLRLRVDEAQRLAALLQRYGRADAADLVRVYVDGLHAGFAEIETVAVSAKQLPPGGGLSSSPPVSRVAPSEPGAASGHPSPEPQVFGSEAGARMADAAVSALPPDEPEEPAPPAATPAPADRGTGSQKASTWTAERIGILTERYPRGDALAEILAAVNAAPGPQVVSVEAVKTQAKKVGLRRAPPPPAEPAPAEPAPAEPAPAEPEPAEPAPPAAAPAGPILTAARREALAALWADTTKSVTMVVAALNALPGPLVRHGSLYYLAQRCGLPSQRPQGRTKPAPAPPAMPAPEPKPAAASPDALARARQLLREGHGEIAIRHRTGLDSATVRALMAQADTTARDLLLAGGLTTEEIADNAGLPAAAVRALRAELREASAA